jgi:hypothetical protein
MNKIGRTLFWFKKSHESLTALDDVYFAYGNLLNRLLNEKYKGKPLKFLNIEFSSEDKYLLFPIIPPNYVHYKSGFLHYYGELNFNKFYELTEQKQINLVWERAYRYLQIAAIQTKNKDLLEASEYAYHKGLETNLNPDFRIIEMEVILYNQVFSAAVWIYFKKDGMYSKFTLEKDDKIVFVKEIDGTQLGV